MDITYVNPHSYIAQSWWERRSFTHRWWRLYRGDPYWVPPYYPTLRRALDPDKNSHLARMQPTLIYTEALPRRKKRALSGNGYAQEPLFEQPVAAAVALGDPRPLSG